MALTAFSSNEECIHLKHSRLLKILDCLSLSPQTKRLSPLLTPCWSKWKVCCFFWNRWLKKLYLILSFLHCLDWLVEEKVQKISMIITNISTKEPLERWDFNVKYEAGSESSADIQELKDTKVTKPGKSNGAAKTGNKELKVIQNEIRDVLRQICSTVSFLPLLDCLCKLILFPVFYVWFSWQELL